MRHWCTRGTVDTWDGSKQNPPALAEERGGGFWRSMRRSASNSVVVRIYGSSPILASKTYVCREVDLVNGERTGRNAKGYRVSSVATERLGMPAVDDQAVLCCHHENVCRRSLLPLPSTNPNGGACPLYHYLHPASPSPRLCRARIAGEHTRPTPRRAAASTPIFSRLHTAV